MLSLRIRLREILDIMPSWTCDGIPKDGKEYPDFGGAHEPYENYSSECDICGLPEKSQGTHVEPPEDGKLNQYILGAVAVGILFLAGGSAAYFSGLVGGDRYLNTYEEAVASGDEALSIIRTHSNSDELAQAQEYLSEAMTKLSQIPQKTAIYPQAEAKMSDYDTQSVQIANKLSSSDFQLCADPKPEICRF